MTLALVALVNALVGACIGLTGIAGFLLPIFYTGALALSPIAALALSFAAFIVSGVLGCPAYRKTGDLPLRASAALMAGSLAGAVAGTQVGLLLPAEVLTVILYVVVLVSGASVLARMRADAHRAQGAEKDAESCPAPALPGAGALFATGAATAVICAASGAGGPVLVVPVLMLLKVPARRAVATALIDSVAVGLPAAWGYLTSGAMTASAWEMFPVALIAHGAGVLVGAANAHRIDARLLKIVVATGSIAIAVVKLVQLAL